MKTLNFVFDSGFGSPVTARRSRLAASAASDARQKFSFFQAHSHQLETSRVSPQFLSVVSPRPLADTGWLKSVPHHRRFPSVCSPHLRPTLALPCSRSHQAGAMLVSPRFAQIHHAQCSFGADSKKSGSAKRHFVPKSPIFGKIMLLTNNGVGRDAALRRPRPQGRNECGRTRVSADRFRRPACGTALGDEDSAARCPYLIFLPNSQLLTLNT